MTDTTVATLSVPIIGDPKQLDAALERAEQRLQQFNRQFGDGLPVPKGGGGDPYTPAATGAAAARDNTLALAQATARLQSAQGDAAGAAETLRGALTDVNRSTVQGLNAQTQLTNLQKRAAAAATGTKSAFQQLGGAIAGIGSALGALGIATGIAALGQFVLAAGKSAVELERTRAVMQQLAGSQERYNQIVRLAEANQRLFGGSINSNLQPLNALLQMSNRTGAELDNLNRAAQLLLASAPGKAFSDASFSLSEFLSNNGAEAALSLADQFNLNKQALAALATEGSSAEERLAGLFDLLAQQGVTQDTLNASLTTNAAAFNALGAAASEAFTNIGAEAAAAAAPVANFITAGLEGFNQLVAKSQEAAALAPQVFAASQDGYSAYIAQIAAVNAELAKIGERLTPLSEAQYQFAQSLVSTGATAQQAYATVSAATPSLDLYANALGLASKQGPEAAAAIAGFEAIIVNASSATAEGATQTQNLIQAYLDGTIAADDLAIGLSNVELTAIATAQAKADAAAAADALAAADSGAAASMDLAGMAAQAEESALRAATQAAFEKANAGATMEEQARAAAEALLDSGAAGEAAAARLAQSSSQLDQMTAAYYRLEAAARAASVATGALGGLAGMVGGGAGAATVATRARIAAVNRYGGGGGGSSGGGSKGKGKSKGSGGKSDAEKAAEKEAKEAERLNQRLQDIQERYYDQAAEAEERYQERRLAIVEQYAEKRAEAEQDYADQQVEDRLSFYKSLKDIDDQGIRQQASAEYEQFAAKANELRDTKGADVAAEYEAEAARVAAARAKRAEEIKKAEEEAKKDRSKRGDAQYLRDLDKMEREAEQRRLDRAAEGKGSLNDQEAKALADADRQRQEALADAATTAGEAMTKAQQDALERTQATNTALADQVTLLEQIHQKGGLPGAGAVPPLAPATPASPAPTAESPPPTPALPTASASGPVAVEDVALRAAVEAMRRSMDAVERATRRLADSPPTRPGA